MSKVKEIHVKLSALDCPKHNNVLASFSFEEQIYTLSRYINTKKIFLIKLLPAFYSFNPINILLFKESMIRY